MNHMNLDNLKVEKPKNSNTEQNTKLERFYVQFMCNGKYGKFVSH